MDRADSGSGARELFDGSWRRLAVHLRAALLIAALLAVSGCQAATSPTPTAPPVATPDPVPTASASLTPAATVAEGVDGLVAALDAAGIDAKTDDIIGTEPIGGLGATICVGTETLRVYEFIDHEAALAASVKIDREDPSQIGGSMVSWAGKPRFWLRDRIIILYLGEDAATDATLRTVLGPPFAEGEGGMPLPEPPCQ